MKIKTLLALALLIAPAMNASENSWFLLSWIKSKIQYCAHIISEPIKGRLRHMNNTDLFITLDWDNKTNNKKKILFASKWSEKALTDKNKFPQFRKEQ